MLKDLFYNRDFLFRTFHETNSLVFILEKDLHIYDTNIAVSCQLGWGHSVIRHKSFTDLVWDEEKQNTKTILEKTIKNRENIEQNFYIVDKEGEVLLIKFKGFPYENEEDKHIYYILIGDDITTIKLLEQSEMVEYQKFQSLFNLPGTGIALIDLNSNFLDANDMFCRLVNYSRDDLLKMYIDDILFDDVISFDKIKKLLNSDSGSAQYEIQYKDKDNLKKWFLITIVLHTVNNKPLYYVTTVQDISDKKYYELMIKEHEKKYRLLFDRSYNAIVYKKLIYNRKGKIQDYMIIDANLKFEKVTGLNKREIVGRLMKAKAQKHFKVSVKENFSRLKRYDKIMKDGKDVHFKSQPSRTFKNPIDVYYYIVDKKEDLIAVVFGNIDDDKLMNV